MRIVTAWFLVWCGGCAPVVDETLQPAQWTATEAQPIAAVGPTTAAADVPDGVVVARLGPLDAWARVERLQLGQAPGWGCETPALLPVAVWSAEDEQAVGDPAIHVQTVSTTTAERAPLGDGFELVDVELVDEVEGEPGDFLFVGLAHATTTTCGAGTADPGPTWRWRPGEGWMPLGRGLVAGATGVSE